MIFLHLATKTGFSYNFRMRTLHSKNVKYQQYEVHGPLHRSITIKTVNCGIMNIIYNIYLNDKFTASC